MICWVSNKHTYKYMMRSYHVMSLRWDVMICHVTSDGWCNMIWWCGVVWRDQMTWDALWYDVMPYDMMCDDPYQLIPTFHSLHVYLQHDVLLQEHQQVDVIEDQNWPTQAHNTTHHNIYNSHHTIIQHTNIPVDMMKFLMCWFHRIKWNVIVIGLLL